MSYGSFAETGCMMQKKNADRSKLEVKYSRENFDILCILKHPTYIPVLQPLILKTIKKRKSPLLLQHRIIKRPLIFHFGITLSLLSLILQEDEPDDLQLTKLTFISVQKASILTPLYKLINLIHAKRLKKRMTSWIFVCLLFNFSLPSCYAPDCLT